MANEDVSRIMQSKPELRYSPAFVYIKALSWLAMFACPRIILPPPPLPPSSFYPRHFGRVPACVLKLYSARTPDVVSQLAPHLAVNYVYLEHPLHCHLSGPLCRTRAIPRVKLRAQRDISAGYDNSHPGFVLDRYLPCKQRTSVTMRKEYIPKDRLCVFLNNVTQHIKVFAPQQFKQTFTH